MSKAGMAALALALSLAGGGTLAALRSTTAQDGGDGRFENLGEAPSELGHPSAGTPGASVPQQEPEGPPYNGRFTYVRIRYGESGTDLRNMGDMRSGRRGGRGGGGAPWSHDWPRAETNFAKILEATTFIDTYMEGYAGRILTLDDPELFNYPVATIIEVGYWRPSDSEVAHLREYLLKGGFLIIDDTRQDRGYEFQNLMTQMKRALPEYEIQYVPEDHEIFNSFFAIGDPYALVPPYGRNAPQYLGIFEDNDAERGRLMVMINFNQDLQEYWEFSDQGYYPIDLSNEAYKFGVNYMIYAFTH